MAGKYAYPSDDQDVRNILHLLFSDQSSLKYINEILKADNAARLLIDNQVAYHDFADYQKRQIDYLVERGVLEDSDGPVQFASANQFLVLRACWQRVPT